MKIMYNWSIAIVFALPFTWFVAYILYLLPQIQLIPNFVLVVFGGFFLGLLVGGFIADYMKRMVYALIFSETLLLLLGFSQLLFPIYAWASILGNLILFLSVFLFGMALLLFTIFLNRLVPSIRRGRVTSSVTILILAVGGLLSYLWQLFGFTQAPAYFALAILMVVIIGSVMKAWRKELQTYMVPGSMTPFLVWWIIYLTAYGLYVFATPVDSRLLFNSLFMFGSNLLPAELVLFGICLAAFVFLFLPDKLGRKRVFTIASLLLGELVLFGPGHYQFGVGSLVTSVLFIVEVFVTAFIISVGVWLIWAEIGPVRFKGRRAFVGWGLFGVMLTGFWVLVSTQLNPEPFLPFLIFPVAATLVLVSLLPLMNAIQVMPNERVVEDIDISVDSRQVRRAIKDIEVDTSLKSIEEQIKSELEQLMKIKGVSRSHAKTLRNAGYETPTLVASSNVDALVALLPVSDGEAAQILASAQALSKGVSKQRVSKRKAKPKKRASAKKRKSQKRKKS